MRNSSKAFWGLCCITKYENKKLMPRWLWEGRAGSLRGVRVGEVWWFELEGWLKWFAHRLVGAMCQDHTQFPAFAPGSSEMAVGLWCFCILLFVIAFPCVQLCLVPYNFFVFCCSRRCLSRCKHSYKGPWVPASLITLITFFLLLC